MWGVRGHQTDIGDFNFGVGWFLVGGGVRVKYRGVDVNIVGGRRLGGRDWECEYLGDLCGGLGTYIGDVNIVMLGGGVEDKDGD